jgi:hypothetical protein
MGRLRCTRAELDRTTAQAERAPDAERTAAIQTALQARRRLAGDWQTMMTHLLETVDTPGELGTVANLELHTRLSGGYLNSLDPRLEKLLRQPLPADCAIPANYAGKPRLIVPTVRSIVTKGEALKLKIIALPETNVILHVRAMGHGRWKEVPATHLARAVYEAKLPAAQDDFEYYITAGKNLVWPATAPQMNQTVVVVETSRRARPNGPASGIGGDVRSSL